MEIDNNTDPSSVTSSPTSSPGCNLDDLVSRLLKTPITIAEVNYATTFLAVYRMFAAPSELLACIRLHCQFQPSITSPISEDLSDAYPVDRCLAVIERWLNTYPGDFVRPLTLNALHRFLGDAATQDARSTIVSRIQAKLDVTQEDSDTDWAISDSKLEKKLAASGSGQSGSTSESTTPRHSNATPLLLSGLTPTPKRPLKDAEWRLFMLQDEDSIAQELVHISHALFRALPLRDLLRHATPSISDARNSSTSPLSALTTHFNHVGNWTTNLLLLPSKPKPRSLTLSKLMRVARKVRQLNDYNTVAAMVAGMQNTNIHRLRETWELVTPEQRKDFLKLEVLMANARGSATYRLAWENTRQKEGHVPFLAVHQRDLVVAVAGGRTFIEPMVTHPPTEEQAVAGIREFSTHATNPTPSNTGFTSGPATANTSFAESVDSEPFTANTSFTSYTSTSSYATAPAPGATTRKRHSRNINWRKFEVIGATLLTMQAAQTALYPALRRNETIRVLLLESIIEKDEEELYQRSCMLEPAEAAPPPKVPQPVAGGMRAWVGRLGKGMREW